MILNKIYMPIEKHTINIIFFPILYFFFLNKNSESKIAMSIIVIAHTIIYLYFEFVNYAVITNGSAGNGLPLSCVVSEILLEFFLSYIFSYKSICIYLFLSRTPIEGNNISSMLGLSCSTCYLCISKV